MGHGLPVLLTDSARLLRGVFFFFKRVWVPGSCGARMGGEGVVFLVGVTRFAKTPSPRWLYHWYLGPFVLRRKG
jgi:hypothetical protein